MGRSTPDDEAFKRKVAEEFVRARDRACQKGFSVEEFARTLGITRAGLHKYIARKAIPSLRVLQRARQYWGVRLSYGELGDRYIQARKKDPRQMEFKFSVEDVSKEQIRITKFSAKGENSAELVIKIDFSKSA
jgi:transcriptional regulator with XRE-family HTH domain